MVLVTAVIPVFNQHQYIGAAIDSILEQTFKDFEIIVVDDGSTDATPEVLEGYGSRIRVIRQPNRGSAAALNVGIRAAQGRWIGWLSADDLWEPAKLERQVEAIRRSPDVGWTYTDYFNIDIEGEVLSLVHVPPPSSRTRRLLWLIQGCFINGSSTLIRREVFETVGFYDEGNRWTPDWDLWVRIALVYDFTYVPEPLIRYRIHPGQTTAKSAAMALAARRVASKSFRRMGPVLGTLGAILRLKKELRSFPGRARSSAPGRRLFRQVRDLTEWFVILVNPDTTWSHPS